MKIDSDQMAKSKLAEVESKVSALVQQNQELKSKNDR